MIISVIIPIYNAERFMCECIESVLIQSYKNLEIILVDDGSTDNSGTICDDYQKKDKRILVIHKSNNGTYAAVKSGIFMATGDYVGFVDSDDWIEPDMIENLLYSIQLNKADIVTSFLRIEPEGINIESYKKKLKREIYDRKLIQEEIITNIINDGTSFGRVIPSSRGSKLFRRELLLNNLDDNIDYLTFGEDLVLLFSCICDSQKIVVYKDYYPYHYRKNDESVTVKYDQRRIMQIDVLSEALKRIAAKKNFDVSLQIANNALSLYLVFIEIEILYSNLAKDKVISNISKITSLELFKESIKNCDIKNFSIKYKIYKFLIIKKKFRLIHFLCKLLSKIRA